MTIGLLKPQPNEEGYVITSRDELRLTMVEYHGLDRDMVGVCRACGEHSSEATEPDVSDYLCELCGESAVTGVEELLQMGMVKFK